MKSSGFHKNNRFLLRFVTSYSVILILILLMGLFFLYAALNTSKEYAYRQNHSSLEYRVSEVDQSLELFSTLVSQVAEDNNIRSLLYSKSISSAYYQLANAAMNYLAGITALQIVLPVNNFYIYLPETDCIISEDGLLASNLFYQKDKSYPLTDYPAWHEMLSSYHNTETLLPLSDYMEGNPSYLYKLQLSASPSLSVKAGIACFEIDRFKLQQMFESILSAPSYLLYITEADGSLLFTVANGLELSAEAESIISRVHGNSKYGTEQFRDNHEKYCITQVVSSYNGWNYHLIQPSSYLLNDLSAYQKTYVFIILIACILTFVLIYYLSKVNVKPLLAMNDKLASSELENASLQNALSKQHPLVYNAYMAQIMEGTISTAQKEEEIREFLQLKGLGSRYYFVLYASIYLEQLELYREDSEDARLSELNEYEDMLCQSFYQFFGDDILIYHPDINSFALLLSFPPEVSDNDVARYTADTFLELHARLVSEHSLWIFGGLGNGNTKLPYFWKSYQQAKEAASYLRKGNVFQTYAEIQRNSETYYYPFEMAQQLTNFIHAGNSTQILEIFKLIRRENLEYRSLPVTSVKWLLSDIRNTLVKVRYSISETSSNQEILQQIDTCFHQTQTLELMEKLSLSLASLFEQKQDSNKLITAIRQYIRQNYADSSISLKKISEEFAISESYFSYLFKAETGKNFSEYLEEIRMTEAMRLLKKTEVPLSELYLSLGYNNPNSFRRAFKKVYGVSPKTIRDASDAEENIE